MYKFKELDRCPKCIHLRCNSELSDAAMIYVPEEIIVVEKGIHRIPEHLAITCSNCNFTWSERPADYKEKSEEKQN